MPQCNYVILDHHKSDLDSNNLPCLTLLDVDSGSRNRRFMAFVTANIRKLLDEMSNPQRTWMLAVLFDLCDLQQNPDRTNNIKLEQLQSLGVGPLRTVAHGTINVDDADNIWKSICGELEQRSYEELSKDESSSLCTFQALHPDLLKRSALADSSSIHNRFSGTLHKDF